jgi:DNA-binding NarL/FixJ family response regulator
MDIHQFTQGEQRVALALLQYPSIPEVAEALGVAPQTIKNHLSSMMRKTQTANRLAMVLCLLQLEPEPLPEPVSYHRMQSPRRERAESSIA